MGQLLSAVLDEVLDYVGEKLVGAIGKFIGGWGRTIVAGFRESVLQGLLCLFIPPYTIHYAIKLKEQRSEIRSVIWEFIEAGARRNVEAACACCSPHSPTKEEIVGVIESSYEIFAGCKLLTISSQNPKSSGGINTCHVSGGVTYSGNQSWPFEAWLVKDNDVWKITGIQMNSTVGSTAKRWSSKKTRIVAISVGVLAAVVLVPSLIHMFQFFSGVQPVITEFMEAGVARNVEAAYACWSPQMATEEEIAAFIEGSYDVFAGYERLNLNSFEGESSAGITMCYVIGAVIYTGDQSLPLEASLVKENDVWKITSMQIGSTALSFT